MNNAVLFAGRMFISDKNATELPYKVDCIASAWVVNLLKPTVAVQVHL